MLFLAVDFEMIKTMMLRWSTGKRKTGNGERDSNLISLAYLISSAGNSLFADILIAISEAYRCGQYYSTQCRQQIIRTIIMHSILSFGFAKARRKRRISVASLLCSNVVHDASNIVTHLACRDENVSNIAYTLM